MLSFIDIFINEMKVKEQNKYYFVLPTKINRKTKDYASDLANIKQGILINPTRENYINEVLDCLKYFLRIFLTSDYKAFHIENRRTNIDTLLKLGVTVAY